MYNSLINNFISVLCLKRLKKSLIPILPILPYPHTHCFFRIVIRPYVWSSPFCGIDLATLLEMISAGHAVEEQTPLHGELHTIIISVASDAWSVSLIDFRISRFSRLSRKAFHS